MLHMSSGGAVLVFVVVLAPTAPTAAPVVFGVVFAVVVVVFAIAMMNINEKQIRCLLVRGGMEQERGRKEKAPRNELQNKNVNEKYQWKVTGGAHPLGGWKFDH